MSELLQALEQCAQATSKTYDLDTEGHHEFVVKDMLAQLLTFPRANSGMVPDSWGPNNRAESKRVSTDTDSVYVLDSRVRSALNG